MKYIFIGPNSQASIVLLKDLFSEKNVTYIDNPSIISDYYFSKYFVKLLYRLEFAFNGLVAGFLVKVFCTKKLVKLAKNNKGAVFVYFHPWISTVVDSGIMYEIKRKNLDIKHVAMFYDIQIMNKHDLDKMRQNYHILATYDEIESFKAGIDYIPPVYSPNKIEFQKLPEEYDVSFVGKAKDRFDLLIEIYDYLDKRGIKCHFFIFGVPRNRQIIRPGIVYGNKEIPTDEADKYIESSKCILDLAPYGTTALTSRHREAVIYGKKLLSNNKSLLNDKYYSTGNMQYFNSVDEIDVSFFKKEQSDYGYQGEYRATNFLVNLEKLVDRL